MASTVLPNGIIIPEKYSRDWYADLYHNWQELDNLLGGGTPKDGTLTIQKNGTTIGTFSANQATDETINIEVPDVNNGTLTIQQNGTAVDTFTANSSSDKTVNIQCVDLTSNQTVAGNKEFTGTTGTHDVVPATTDTYDLGSSANKWKSFNGLNPGSLSLPSVSSGINLDLTNFKTDGSDNKFRLTSFSNYPYDNGWLFVRLNGCTSYYLDHWYKVVSDSYATPSEAIFFLPINDKDHDIMLRCVCTSINYIRIFPCQGNV